MVKKRAKMNHWNMLHGKIIKDFLKFVNERYPDSFVLKGGTALSLCYKSRRFSNDVDLDGMRHNNILEAVGAFCKENRYSFKVVKNTDVVTRCKIDYGIQGAPLKIEASYRCKCIDPTCVTKIGGITVYTMNEMASLKALAYAGRDKIRDMYDLGFICDRHYKELRIRTKAMIRDAIEGKGIEHFDYLTQNQPGEINIDELEDLFLKMCDKLGMMRKTSRSNRFTLKKRRGVRGPSQRLFKVNGKNNKNFKI